MSNKSTDFPQYRKLSNGKVFYKIVSDRIFEEKQILGKRVLAFRVEAQKYPEILRIQDMLCCSDHTYQSVPESEWDALVADQKVDKHI